MWKAEIQKISWPSILGAKIWCIDIHKKDIICNAAKLVSKSLDGTTKGKSQERGAGKSIFCLSAIIVPLKVWTDVSHQTIVLFFFKKIAHVVSSMRIWTILTRKSMSNGGSARRDLKSKSTWVLTVIFGLKNEPRDFFPVKTIGLIDLSLLKKATI